MPIFNEFKSIGVHDRTIRVQLIGEPGTDDRTPLLVFLHDGLGSIEQWKGFPEKIAERTGLPALVYDRYGHGGSSQLEEDRELRYMHEEAFHALPAILDRLGLENSLVHIGHSDGGSIALLHGARFPQKVTGIVSIAAHVFVEEITIKGIRRTVREYQSGRLGALLRKYHGSNTDRMFYGWADIWISDAFRDWNIEEDIRGVRSPVLLIQGEKDPYGTMAQVEGIEKAVAGRTERYIPKELGHMPQQEDPEKVGEQILEFIVRNRA